jgi:hypothetical protein
VQAGEKVYQDFQLSITDEGGHSSRPKKHNAIVQMSAALARLGAYQFPIAVNDAVRGYFEAQAKQAAPAVAADMRAVLRDPADEAAASRLWDVNPGWNGMLRTTCIATMVDGGHAPNALPQKVTANVNCRILPNVPVAQVQQTIERVLADPAIRVAPVGELGQSTVPPPLGADILGPVRAVADGIWPHVAIVPTMSTGATDGRFPQCGRRSPPTECPACSTMPKAAMRTAWMSASACSRCSTAAASCINWSSATPTRLRRRQAGKREARRDGGDLRPALPDRLDQGRSKTSSVENCVSSARSGS